MPIQSRLIALIALPFLAFSAAVHADISIRSENGRLTVQASDVSASELAEELSEQLGISVVVTGNAETRVNLDIIDEPLETALGKLAPNNMLVRNSQATEIIEVVLMMGEGESGVSGGSEEFLPTGSPAEPVQDDQALQQEEEQARQIREAAAAASNDPNLPAAQLPPMYGEEGPAEVRIDPATGLPVEQQ